MKDPIGHVEKTGCVRHNPNSTVANLRQTHAEILRLLLRCENSNPAVCQSSSRQLAVSASALQVCSNHCCQDPPVHCSSGGSVMSLRRCPFFPMPIPLPWFPPFTPLNFPPFWVPLPFPFLSPFHPPFCESLWVMCSSVPNTVHDVSFHTAYVEVSLPSMVRTPTFFCSVPVLPALVTVSLECIKIHRCRCSDGFSRVLDRLNLSNKNRPAVAFRGAHQKMFFHAVLAHTGNDATNFQGIADRLAALSLIDHDLPLKSGESIKEVTVKRRAQYLRQLPDHTR